MAAQARQHILVVEDNRFLQMFYRTALRRAGFEVTVASTGGEALPKARECHPDLVILDLLLPKITGREVLQQLKSSADFNSVPVLVISSLTPANVQGLGLAGHIRKDDLTEETLLSAVARATGEQPAEESQPNAAVTPES